MFSYNGPRDEINALRNPRTVLQDWFTVDVEKLRKNSHIYSSMLMKWKTCKDEKIVSFLKAYLKKIMQNLQSHLNYSNQQILFSDEIEDNLIQLVSLYVDLELRAWPSLHRVGAVPHRLISRLLHWLYTILQTPDKRADALLGLVMVYTDSSKIILDPIFRKILNEFDYHSQPEAEYVRILLLFKLWEECVRIGEDEEVLRLRRKVKELKPARSYYMMPEVLKSCLPYVGKNVRNVTDYFLGFNISLKKACGGFLKCRRVDIAHEIDVEALRLTNAEKNEVTDLVGMFENLKPVNDVEIVSDFIDLTYENDNVINDDDDDTVIDLTDDVEVVETKSTQPQPQPEPQQQLQQIQPQNQQSVAYTPYMLNCPVMLMLPERLNGPEHALIQRAPERTYRRIHVEKCRERRRDDIDGQPEQIKYNDRVPQFSAMPRTIESTRNSDKCRPRDTSNVYLENHTFYDESTQMNDISPSDSSSVSCVSEYSSRPQLTTDTSSSSAFPVALHRDKQIIKMSSPNRNIYLPSTSNSFIDDEPQPSTSRQTSPEMIPLPTTSKLFAGIETRFSSTAQIPQNVLNVAPSTSKTSTNDELRLSSTLPDHDEEPEHPKTTDYAIPETSTAQKPTEIINVQTESILKADENTEKTKKTISSTATSGNDDIAVMPNPSEDPVPTPVTNVQVHKLVKKPEMSVNDIFETIPKLTFTGMIRKSDDIIPKETIALSQGVCEVEENQDDDKIDIDSDDPNLKIVDNTMGVMEVVDEVVTICDITSTSDDVVMICDDDDVEKITLDKIDTKKNEVQGRLTISDESTELKSSSDMVENVNIENTTPIMDIDGKTTNLIIDETNKDVNSQKSINVDIAETIVEIDTIDISKEQSIIIDSNVDKMDVIVDETIEQIDINVTKTNDIVITDETINEKPIETVNDTNNESNIDKTIGIEIDDTKIDVNIVESKADDDNTVKIDNITVDAMVDNPNSDGKNIEKEITDELKAYNIEAHEVVLNKENEDDINNINDMATTNKTEDNDPNLEISEEVFVVEAEEVIVNNELECVIAEDGIVTVEIENEIIEVSPEITDFTDEIHDEGTDDIVSSNDNIAAADNIAVENVKTPVSSTEDNIIRENLIVDTVDIAGVPKIDNIVVEEVANVPNSDEVIEEVNSVSKRSIVNVDNIATLPIIAEMTVDDSEKIKNVLETYAEVLKSRVIVDDQVPSCSKMPDIVHDVAKSNTFDISQQEFPYSDSSNDDSSRDGELIIVPVDPDENTLSSQESRECIVQEESCGPLPEPSSTTGDDVEEREAYSHLPKLIMDRTISSTNEEGEADLTLDELLNEVAAAAEGKESPDSQNVMEEVESRNDGLEMEENRNEVSEDVENRNEVSEEAENRNEVSEQAGNCIETSKEAENCIETTEEAESSIETLEKAENAIESSEQAENRIETSEQPENRIETSGEAENCIEASEALENQCEEYSEVREYDDGLSDENEVATAMETHNDASKVEETPNENSKDNETRIETQNETQKDNKITPPFIADPSFNKLRRLIVLCERFDEKTTNNANDSKLGRYNLRRPSMNQNRVQKHRMRRGRVMINRLINNNSDGTETVDEEDEKETEKTGTTLENLDLINKNLIDTIPLNNELSTNKNESKSCENTMSKNLKPTKLFAKIISINKKSDMNTIPLQDQESTVQYNSNDVKIVTNSLTSEMSPIAPKDMTILPTDNDVNDSNKQKIMLISSNDKDKTIACLKKSTISNKPKETTVCLRAFKKLMSYRSTKTVKKSSKKDVTISSEVSSSGKSPELTVTKPRTYNKKPSKTQNAFIIQQPIVETIEEFEFTNEFNTETVELQTMNVLVEPARLNAAVVSESVQYESITSFESEEYETCFATTSFVPSEPKYPVIVSQPITYETTIYTEFYEVGKARDAIAKCSVNGEAKTSSLIVYCKEKKTEVSEDETNELPDKCNANEGVVTRSRNRAMELKPIVFHGHFTRRMKHIAKPIEIDVADDDYNMNLLAKTALGEVGETSFDETLKITIPNASHLQLSPDDYDYNLQSYSLETGCAKDFYTEIVSPTEDKKLYVTYGQRTKTKTDGTDMLEIAHLEKEVHLNLVEQTKDDTNENSPEETKTKPDISKVRGLINRFKKNETLKKSTPVKNQQSSYIRSTRPMRMITRRRKTEQPDITPVDEVKPGKLSIDEAYDVMLNEVLAEQPKDAEKAQEILIYGVSDTPKRTKSNYTLRSDGRVEQPFLHSMKSIERCLKDLKKDDTVEIPETKKRSRSKSGSTEGEIDAKPKRKSRLDVSDNENRRRSPRRSSTTEKTDIVTRNLRTKSTEIRYDVDNISETIDDVRTHNLRRKSADVRYDMDNTTVDMIEIESKRPASKPEVVCIAPEDDMEDIDLATRMKFETKAIDVYEFEETDSERKVPKKKRDKPKKNIVNETVPIEEHTTPDSTSKSISKKRKQDLSKTRLTDDDDVTFVSEAESTKTEEIEDVSIQETSNTKQNVTEIKSIDKQEIITSEQKENKELETTKPENIDDTTQILTNSKPDITETESVEEKELVPSQNEENNKPEMENTNYIEYKSAKKKRISRIVKQDDSETKTKDEPQLIIPQHEENKESETTKPESTDDTELKTTKTTRKLRNSKPDVVIISDDEDNKEEVLNKSPRRIRRTRNNKPNDSNPLDNEANGSARNTRTRRHTIRDVPFEGMEFRSPRITRGRRNPQTEILEIVVMEGQQKKLELVVEIEDTTEIEVEIADKRSVNNQARPKQEKVVKLEQKIKKEAQTANETGTCDIKTEIKEEDNKADIVIVGSEQKSKKKTRAQPELRKSDVKTDIRQADNIVVESNEKSKKNTQTKPELTKSDDNKEEKLIEDKRKEVVNVKSDEKLKKKIDRVKKTKDEDVAKTDSLIEESDKKSKKNNCELDTNQVPKLENNKSDKKSKKTFKEDTNKSVNIEENSSKEEELITKSKKKIEYKQEEQGKVDKTAKEQVIKPIQVEEDLSSKEEITKVTKENEQKVDEKSKKKSLDTMKTKEEVNHTNKTHIFSKDEKLEILIESEQKSKKRSQSKCKTHKEEKINKIVKETVAELEPKSKKKSQEVKKTKEERNDEISSTTKEETKKHKSFEIMSILEDKVEKNNKLQKKESIAEESKTKEDKKEKCVSDESKKNDKNIKEDNKKTDLVSTSIEKSDHKSRKHQEEKKNKLNELKRSRTKKVENIVEKLVEKLNKQFDKKSQKSQELEKEKPTKPRNEIIRKESKYEEINIFADDLSIMQFTKPLRTPQDTKKNKLDSPVSKVVSKNDKETILKSMKKTPEVKKSKTESPGRKDDNKNNEKIISKTTVKTQETKKTKNELVGRKDDHKNNKETKKNTQETKKSKMESTERKEDSKKFEKTTEKTPETKKTKIESTERKEDGKNYEKTTEKTPETKKTKTDILEKTDKETIPKTTEKIQEIKKTKTELLQKKDDRRNDKETVTKQDKKETKIESLERKDDNKNGKEMISKTTEKPQETKNTKTELAERKDDGKNEEETILKVTKSIPETKKTETEKDDKGKISNSAEKTQGTDDNKEIVSKTMKKTQETKNKIESSERKDNGTRKLHETKKIKTESPERNNSSKKDEETISKTTKKIQETNKTKIESLERKSENRKDKETSSDVVETTQKTNKTVVESLENKDVKEKSNETKKSATESPETKDDIKVAKQILSKAARKSYEIKKCVMGSSDDSKSDEQTKVTKKPHETKKTKTESPERKQNDNDRKSRNRSQESKKRKHDTEESVSKKSDITTNSKENETILSKPKPKPESCSVVSQIIGDIIAKVESNLERKSKETLLAEKLNNDLNKLNEITMIAITETRKQDEIVEPKKRESKLNKMTSRIDEIINEVRKSKNLEQKDNETIDDKKRKNEVVEIDSISKKMRFEHHIGLAIFNTFKDELKETATKSHIVDVDYLSELYSKSRFDEIVLSDLNNSEAYNVWKHINLALKDALFVTKPNVDETNSKLMKFIKKSTQSKILQLLQATETSNNDIIEFIDSVNVKYRDNGDETTLAYDPVSTRLNICGLELEIDDSTEVTSKYCKGRRYRKRSTVIIEEMKLHDIDECKKRKTDEIPRTPSPTKAIIESINEMEFDKNVVPRTPSPSKALQSVSEGETSIVECGDKSGNSSSEEVIPDIPMTPSPTPKMSDFDPIPNGLLVSEADIQIEGRESAEGVEKWFNEMDGDQKLKKKQKKKNNEENEQHLESVYSDWGYEEITSTMSEHPNLEAPEVVTNADDNSQEIPECQDEEEHGLVNNLPTNETQKDYSNCLRIDGANEESQTVHEKDYSVIDLLSQEYETINGPYYDSFERYNKDREHEQKGMQASYDVADVQYLSYCEEDIFNNMVMQNPLMMVNPKEIQPQVKTILDEDKRNEFEDFDHSDQNININEVVNNLDNLDFPDINETNKKLIESLDSIQLGNVDITSSSILETLLEPEPMLMLDNNNKYMLVTHTTTIQPLYTNVPIRTILNIEQSPPSGCIIEEIPNNEPEKVVVKRNQDDRVINVRRNIEDDKVIVKRNNDDKIIIRNIDEDRVVVMNNADERFRRVEDKFVMRNVQEEKVVVMRNEDDKIIGRKCVSPEKVRIVKEDVEALKKYHEITRKPPQVAIVKPLKQSAAIPTPSRESDSTIPSPSKDNEHQIRPTPDENRHITEDNHRTSSEDNRRRPVSEHSRRPPATNDDRHHQSYQTRSSSEARRQKVNVSNGEDRHRTDDRHRSGDRRSNNDHRSSNRTSNVARSSSGDKNRSDGKEKRPTAEELFDRLKNSTMDEVEKPAHRPINVYYPRTAFKNATQKIKDEYTTQSRKRKAQEHPQTDYKRTKYDDKMYHNRASYSKSSRDNRDLFTRPVHSSERAPEWNTSTSRRYSSTRMSSSSSRDQRDNYEKQRNLWPGYSSVRSESSSSVERPNERENDDNWFKNPILLSELDRAKKVYGNLWEGDN